MADVTIDNSGDRTVPRRRLVGVWLFSLCIPVWYMTLINYGVSNFQEALENRSTSGVPIYLTGFQQWSFDIMSLLCDGLLVAIGVGILFYLVRTLPVYVGILFGLFSKYALVVGVLIYALFKDPTSLHEFVKQPDLRLTILLSLQLLMTICCSYIGAVYGKRSEYLDHRDQDQLYLAGVPKKSWLLLVIVCRPVVEFLSRLTIVQIYAVTERIQDMKFWKDTFSISNIFSDDTGRGVTGLLGRLLLVFFVWGFAATLFSFGLRAIRDKQIKHRWLRICAVFAFIPAVITIVPLLRNRTWFF